MSYIDEIYVLTRDVGILVGLGRIRKDSKGLTYSVKWERFLDYYFNYCKESNLSYAQTGIDVNMPRISNGNTSKNELMMPEYLNTKAIFGIANMQ